MSPAVLIGSLGAGIVLVIIILLKLRAKKPTSSSAERQEEMTVNANNATSERTTLSEKETVLSETTAPSEEPTEEAPSAEPAEVMPAPNLEPEAEPKIPSSLDAALDLEPEDDDVVDEDLDQALADLGGPLEQPAEVLIENRDPIPPPAEISKPGPKLSDGKQDEQIRRARELAASVRAMLESSTFTDVEELKSFLKDRQASS